MRLCTFLLRKSTSIPTRFKEQIQEAIGVNGISSAENPLLSILCSIREEEENGKEEHLNWCWESPGVGVQRRSRV